jgi:hypothetical protein
MSLMPLALLAKKSVLRLRAFVDRLIFEIEFRISAPERRVPEMLPD